MSKRIIVAALGGLILLVGAPADAWPYPAASIDGIASPYYFSIIRYEVGQFFSYAPARSAVSRPGSAEEQAAIVREYFELLKQAGSTHQPDGSIEKRIGQIQPEAQEIVRNQVEAILVQQGLTTGIGPLRTLFPPLSFNMEELPNLLVVSPRDRIELYRTVLLDPSLSATQITQIEDAVEKLGFSAEIERVGGVALYPSMVPFDESLQRTLQTIAHEWLHQYLFFYPLGRAYWSSYDLTLINETVAELAGQEIGAIAYATYYGPSPAGMKSSASAGGFDFNREMRSIRLQVDALLQQHQVSQVEAYMRESRNYLEQHGYYIQRLNQAYFAFHGSYGDDPSAVSPLQAEVYQIRDRSQSVGDFVRLMSGISSESDLGRLLAAK